MGSCIVRSHLRPGSLMVALAYSGLGCNRLSDYRVISLDLRWRRVNAQSFDQLSQGRGVQRARIDGFACDLARDQSAARSAEEYAGVAS